MVEPRRLLILGGTHEAVALAEAAAALSGLEVITSLAGRTRHPALPSGALRRGGFGGADGLAAYLEEAGIDLVVDATHPFAVRISRHAAEACAGRGLSRLMLVRPAWQPVADDRWIEVPDLAAAATALAGLGRRVFLAVGRTELGAFAALEGCWFLVRLVDPPDGPLPLRDHDVVTGRGPFGLAAERALLTRHRVEALVSKNSGGDGSYAKIAAARALKLPVVMVRRPALPAGERAATASEALGWLRARLGLEPNDG
jgi:precorrin-6A/cobalt-precorrin-6A reductase